MRDAALLGARLLLGGYRGALSITGVAFPAGPLAVAGAMAVAAAHSREGGLMATGNGVELPVAYLALALTLAAAGPGRCKIGPGLPTSWRRSASWPPASPPAR